ncbi:PorP/SprF family type IX secretion system membrane protein [Flavihumibacter profundi]|uniref:PorP/SprF family type IX secretion system membrane protein n=1 Tax=Flavihumibacter profundi TaxID=2716883 RepID=UPI001CC584A4|nr:PorP/SprF family type IX secretion system membrane protein [Flavihumibacter profundi]MBZ5859252.1 PorP/SprF family type IX secretion system membrane protein [Flavihumibacter profundi]
MKKTKIHIITLLLLALTTQFNGFAQDIHFSQFYEAPLLRNPSLAGIFTGDIRAQLVYRDQWNSFTNAYKSGSFNAEYKMPVGHSDDFITAGIQMLYDKAGTVSLTSTHILPAVNYHKALSSERNMYLSVGFMGGIVQKSIDRSKVTTDNQFTGGAYNPSIADGESFANANYMYADASVGTSFNTSFGSENTNNLFFGIGYHHLNRPSNSFYRNANEALHPKWVYSAGVRFDVNEQAFFNLQADYSKQGTATEIIGGALYGYKIGSPDVPDYILYAGAFLRMKDALIPVIKIDYHPFAIGISYDVNVSQLKTASQGRGGFELSVTYIGFLDRESSSKFKIFCPRF